MELRFQLKHLLVEVDKGGLNPCPIMNQLDSGPRSLAFG
jgi:hypothetical protein